MMTMMTMQGPRREDFSLFFSEHFWLSLRTYPFQTTKLSRKHDICNFQPFKGLKFQTFEGKTLKELRDPCGDGDGSGGGGDGDSGGDGVDGDGGVGGDGDGDIEA